MKLAGNGSDNVSGETRRGWEEEARSSPVNEEERDSWLVHHVIRPGKRLYTTVVIEFILRRRPLPPSKNGRHVPLDIARNKPLIDERRGQPYVSNSIRSSRYTIWDFLPKQFAFQATRLSNFYFICIGIPQAIPGFSTTGNYTTILPLTFFLILTIIKEGYDDYRRHRLDKVENATLAVALRNKSTGTQSMTRSFRKRVLDSFLVHRKLRGRTNRRCAVAQDPDQDDDYHWTQVKWHDVRVGDVLKLNRNDPVPADVALLYASGEDGVAYVETMALDGETSLKGKQAPSALRHCCDIQAIKSCRAEIVVEDPNRDLYDLNGSVSINDETIPLTLNEVLLRGSVLRNTKCAIGLVVHSGEECKIRMNANHHPKAKKPRLERYTNQVVLTLIAYVIILSVGCSVGYLLWHSSYEVHAWYLHHASVPFKQIIIGFLIMFNNVIPLALYVSLEIVKIGQMLMIAGDVGMYDEESNTPMICNTNTILENLGQVSYILSDKTGTLTENVMRFRGLSVAGTAWLHKMNDDPVAPAQDIASPTERTTSVGRKSEDKRQSSVDPANRTSAVLVRERELQRPSPLERRESDYFGRPSLTRRFTDRSIREQKRLRTTELIQYMQQHPNTAFTQKAREFILALALCHTAIPEAQDDGSIGFQASSPDELALVRAAQDFGMLVSSRTSQSITLLISDSKGTESQEIYEVLDIVEFSSKRKRMSIIVRCPDGRIWLLCKGADSAIIPRLKQASLAARTSAEVRRSIQIERDLTRKSEHSEPRNSFGGRPSLTIRGRSSMDVRVSMDIQAVSKRNTLEVPTFGHSEKPFRPSFDRRRSKDNRFAFLNELSTADDSVVFHHCFRHLDTFATEGLRTLLFAGKIIGDEDYSKWKEIYQDATTSLTNRQERIEAAGDMLEQGFDLLGASAIEDKLQKGVPETIDKLRRANIKIWMLTGDKRETAISIAHSAQICQPGSEISILDSTRGDLEGQLRDLADDVQNEGVHSVAVIDGHTLAEVEDNALLTHLFYSLINSLDSVICCRASPAQKASIVKGIRARQSGLTLAIGDGANDIAMITASHVGVGISGKEGLQAARVADYSIAQFRFMQRLLLVHGRWNYVRTAKFILWTYWKEMFFYMVQALYQHFDGYTGSSLYENWSLTVLNTLFTSLCVIVPGIFEQDLHAETLLAVPELYVYGQRNEGLNLQRYIRWMALAVGEGMLIWWLPYVFYGKGDIMGDNGTFAIGDLCFSLAIMWTNTKLLMIETHYKSLIVLLSFAITTSGWWAWNAFLSLAYAPQISPFSVRGGFLHTFGPNPTWWAVLIATWAILVVFELLQKFVRQQLIAVGLWPPGIPLWRKGSTAPADDQRTAEQLGVEVWQEMEQDEEIQLRLRELAREGDESDLEEKEDDDEESDAQLEERVSEE